MKHYLNKVQTLIPLLGRPKYAMSDEGTKRYDFITPFLVYRFMFTDRQYQVYVYNRIDNSKMFNDQGYLSSEIEINYTFETLAQIMVACELV